MQQRDDLATELDDFWFPDMTTPDDWSDDNIDDLFDGLAD